MYQCDDGTVINPEFVEFFEACESDGDYWVRVGFASGAQRDIFFNSISRLKAEIERFLNHCESIKNTK